MKRPAFILSGRAAFLLLAAAAAVYVSLTFGNENPFTRFLYLLRTWTALTFLLLVLAAQVLLMALWRIRQGGRGQAPQALCFLSLSFILAGLILSATTRDSEKVRVRESDRIGSSGAVEQIRMDIPGEVLIIGETGEFSVRGVSAIVNDGGRRRTIVPYPFVSTSGGYAYVSNAGISPLVSVDTGAGHAEVSLLELFPPGRRASVALGSGFTAEISLSPEKEFRKGRLTARQYDLREPSYRVVVKKDNAPILDGIVGHGRPVTASGASVRCHETIPWVEIVTVRDRAFLLVYAGIAGLLLSIVLYPAAFIVRRLWRPAARG